MKFSRPFVTKSDKALNLVGGEYYVFAIQHTVQLNENGEDQHRINGDYNANSIYPKSHVLRVLSAPLKKLKGISLSLNAFLLASALSYIIF